MPALGLDAFLSLIPAGEGGRLGEFGPAAVWP